MCGMTEESRQFVRDSQRDSEEDGAESGQKKLQANSKEFKEHVLAKPYHKWFQCAFAQYTAFCKQNNNAVVVQENSFRTWSRCIRYSSDKVVKLLIRVLGALKKTTLREGGIFETPDGKIHVRHDFRVLL